jgi:hypothetical protein
MSTVLDRQFWVDNKHFKRRLDRHFQGRWKNAYACVGKALQTVGYGDESSRMIETTIAGSVR